MSAITRKGLHFHSRVNSDSTEVEKFNVKQDATVEKATVRFYPGQQLDLQLKLQVLDENGNTKEIVDPVGEFDYLAGDDDKFEFDISVPIRDTDQIVIRADNVDTDGYSYDYIVNMEFDRIGGIERVINKLQGVF